MKKQVASIFAVILMAVALAACGSSVSVPEGRFVREGGGGYGGILDGYISVEFRDGEMTTVSYDTLLSVYHTSTYAYEYKDGSLTLEGLFVTIPLTIVDKDTIRIGGQRYIR